jgi:single-stranded-DNA-specific exonuclease
LLGTEGERAFFSPRFSDLNDPFLFPGMDAAVARILAAREKNERIVIFGDYDVDGVSSTAMLVRFFSSLGIQVSYRLPHRVHDGYGMKPYFMDELAEKAVKLVISVDCGTRDVETVRHGHGL